ncbi:hypothetical protein [Coprococcus sp. HCN-4056]|uniref:hypothetical protein n=1 Tax=Coprococcus sp. HCN-4056 TaxID=3134671 RepID=UPI0030C5AA01
MNETICNVMLFGGIALAVVFAVIAVILFVKLDIPKVIGDLSGSTARKQIKEIREKGYESLQGSGASKKDAIKSKGSTSKIEVRDIKGKSASEEVSRKGNERYKKAVDELNKSRSHHHTRLEEADSEKATDILRPEEDYEKETDILRPEEDYEKETDILRPEEDYEKETDILRPEEDYEKETDVLRSEEDYEKETDVLRADDEYERETDILTSEDEADAATDVLSTDSDATDVLSTDDDATDVLTMDTEASDSSETDIQGEEAEKFPLLVDVVVVHTDESI